MSRRLAAAVGVVLLVLVAAGCGGDDSKNADEVAQYIEDVNAVQHGLALPLGDVSLGYRQLSKGSNLVKLQPKLERSVRTIDRLERRVDALEPPPEALRLDGYIRKLVHGESELAAELALLAAYVRDATPVQTRASAAGTSLRDALQKERTRAAQAAALEQYAVPLAAAAKQLEQLHAPAVVAPSQATQVSTYRAVARRSRELAAALRAGKNGAQEVHDLQVAVASSASIGAQKARIAAIKAFNRSTRSLRELAAKAQRERNRLEHTLS